MVADVDVGPGGIDLDSFLADVDFASVGLDVDDGIVGEDFDRGLWLGWFPGLGRFAGGKDEGDRRREQNAGNGKFHGFTTSREAGAVIKSFASDRPGPFSFSGLKRSGGPTSKQPTPIPPFPPPAQNHSGQRAARRTSIDASSHASMDWSDPLRRFPMSSACQIAGVDVEAG